MPTIPRRGKPYVWISWPTSLLSGDKQCTWAVWFKAHFKYERLQDGSFDRAAWSAAHNALVAKRKAELEAEGWSVTVEDQNAMRLEGQTVVLAGKADLIATKGDDMLVVDCKSGWQRHSDYWQVLLYMLVLERQRPGKTIRGEVYYPTHAVPVRMEELNGERRGQIVALLRQMGADARPDRVPSQRECSWCDIPASDCPARFVDAGSAVPVTAMEF